MRVLEMEKQKLSENRIRLQEEKAELLARHKRLKQELATAKQTGEGDDKAKAIIGELSDIIIEVEATESALAAVGTQEAKNRIALKVEITKALPATMEAKLTPVFWAGLQTQILEYWEIEAAERLAKKPSGNHPWLRDESLKPYRNNRNIQAAAFIIAQALETMPDVSIQEVK